MPIPQSRYNAEIEALVDLLSTAQPGIPITFEQCSQAIGRNIKQYPYLLQRAFDKISPRLGMNFSSVRGVGYELITTENSSAIGQMARRRVRSTTKRGSRKIMNAMSRANWPDDAQSAQAKLKAYSEVSSLNLLNELARVDPTTSIPEARERPVPVGVAARGTLRALGIEVKEE